MQTDKIINEIKKQKNEEFAAHHAKFFKTQKGGYGEGDLFYGLKVPPIRQVVKENYKITTLKDVEKLISNPYHEVRLCAAFIMVEKFKKATEEEKTKIVEIYLNNTKYINNWDLVDLSAPQILGNYWSEENSAEIWKLANSKNLWEERIAVLTTFGFIKKGKYKLTQELCKHFLDHKHDLIHKATGWMLREIGKRDLKELFKFLDKHHKTMPRTMLRYSIEKLSEQERKYYMAK